MNLRDENSSTVISIKFMREKLNTVTKIYLFILKFFYDKSNACSNKLYAHNHKLNACTNKSNACSDNFCPCYCTFVSEKITKLVTPCPMTFIHQNIHYHSLWIRKWHNSELTNHHFCKVTSHTANHDR